MHKKFNLLDVVPHDLPMSLLHEVIEYGEDFVTCGLLLDDTTPFFDHETQSVPSYIGVEYMAQCIAAFSGIQSKLSNEPVKIGFLLGSRKYAPSVSEFVKGQSLIINAKRVIQEESGLCVFDCTISDGETVLANAKINAFQPEDAQAFLRGSNE